MFTASSKEIMGYGETRCRAVTVTRTSINSLPRKSQAPHLEQSDHGIDVAVLYEEQELRGRVGHSHGYDDAARGDRADEFR